MPSTKRRRHYQGENLPTPAYCQEFVDANTEPLIVADHQLTRRQRVHILHLPGDEVPTLSKSLVDLLLTAHRAGFAQVSIVDEWASDPVEPEIHVFQFRPPKDKNNGKSKRPNPLDFR